MYTAAFDDSEHVCVWMAVFLWELVYGFQSDDILSSP